MNMLPTLSFMQLHEKMKYEQLLISLDSIQDTSGIHVSDAQTLNEAAISISQYKSIEKEIEKTRKFITEPLNGLVKETNAYFKNLLIQSPIVSERERLDKEVMAYSNAEKAKVEAIRRAQQIKLEEEALNYAIATGKDQPAIIVETIIPQFKVSNQTAFITTAVIKKWRLININLVPRNYFLLDELAINAVRRGSNATDVSLIPGIEFYTEDSVRAK